MRRRNASTTVTDDAYQAITTIGGWVTNAEAKVGLLTAAVTVLAGAVVRQRDQVEQLLLATVDTRGLIGLIALGVCVVALVVCAWHLFRALQPHLDVGQEPSRFAFPDLAGAELEVLADPASVATARREAWVQAQTLARIARDKYRSFALALRAGIAAGIAFVGWLVLAA